MRRRRIFIGSSGETRDSLAEPIAGILSENQFKVERWWEVFKAGDITLQKLTRVAKEVDGAVFICKGTDRVWMKKKEVNAARDNVILELGMFVQQLGHSRCVVIKDNETHLPTDLDGLVYIPIAGDTTNLARKVVSHFLHEFNNPLEEEPHAQPQVFITENDPNIVRIISRERIPTGWHARALFFGTDGAQKWLAMERQEDYLSGRQKDQMCSQILSLIRRIESIDQPAIETLVSLGPGTADVDRALAVTLGRERRRVQYIPVDISEGLLNYACSVLWDCARVPFGILTDFEEGSAFIQNRLQLQGRVLYPILFSLLGNTLGNLDRKETIFMRGMEGLLRKGDYLLLEVAIFTPEWKLEKDIRYDVSSHKKEMRAFYAHGLARQAGEPIQSILDAYPQRIEVKTGYSDVLEAKSIDYVDNRTHRVIISLRRYDWGKFLSWLEDFDFTIIGEQSFDFDEGGIGIGAIVLKRN